LDSAGESTVTPHRDGWISEEKYDERRIVAYKVGNGVRLTLRNGRDTPRVLAR